ncbi:MAG: DUF116 domain-containing protein [Bacteroidales bacterium]|nr:DUF116 domain-containing protein [Bacteroidales bacterium]
MTVKKQYQPVRGRTYSLFGAEGDTAAYYVLVDGLAEKLLSNTVNPSHLPEELRKAGRSLKAFMHFTEKYQITQEAQILSAYITDLDLHLKELPFFTPLNSMLRNKRSRYYSDMISIAVMNRMNREKFLGTGCRIALLPHCLREDIDGCRAESDGTDYLCRSCRKGCYVSEVSEILNKQGIMPYIWMTAGLKQLLNEPGRKHGSIGVLGIACIPELAAGMRKVHAKGIPVVGMPLNANRCQRWMGTFMENSVNLEYLKKLTCGKSESGFEKPPGLNSDGQTVCYLRE